MKTGDESADSRQVVLLMNETLNGFLGSKVNDIKRTNAVLSTIRSIIDEIISHRDFLSSIGMGKVQSLLEYGHAAHKYELICHPIASEWKSISQKCFEGFAIQQAKKAYKEFRQLKNTQDKLSKTFAMEDVPDTVTICHIRKILRAFQGSWLKWFHSEYREIRKELKRFVHPKARRSGENLLQQLSVLDEFLSAKETFVHDATYKDIFQSFFGGFSTNWQKLENVLLWIQSLQKEGLTYDKTAEIIELKNRKEFSPTAITVSQCAERLKLELQNPLIQLLFRDNTLGLEQAAFEIIKSFVSERETALTQFTTAIASFKHTMETTIADIVQNAENVMTLLKNRDELRVNHSFHNLWEDLYQAENTPLKPMEEALNYMGRVLQLKLPLDAVEWLLKAELKQNSEILRTLCTKPPQVRISCESYNDLGLHPEADTAQAADPRRKARQSAAEVRQVCETSFNSSSLFEHTASEV